RLPWLQGSRLREVPHDLAAVAQHVVRRLHLCRQARRRADRHGDATDATLRERLDLAELRRRRDRELDVLGIASRLLGSAAHLVEELGQRATRREVAVTEASGTTG